MQRIRSKATGETKNVSRLAAFSLMLLNSRGPFVIMSCLGFVILETGISENPSSN